MLDAVKPEIPEWAADAGLPRPEPSESFCDYCVRLGYDPDEILVELTDTTAVLANYRLAAAIRTSLPKHYQAWLEEYLSARIEPERRKQLRQWSHDLMPRSWNGRPSS